jgi:hypothetical protein
MLIAMTSIDADRLISFDLQPEKQGPGWLVVATDSSGRVDYITGFRDEVEAFSWIGSQRQQEWLRTHGR